MKDVNYDVTKKVCSSIIGFTVIYLVFRIVPLDLLFVIGVLLGTFAVLLKVTWSRLREKGTYNVMQV